jgi:hypothetical protein
MCSLLKGRSRHSGLHINIAAEFVSMESLLDDTPALMIRWADSGVYCTLVSVADRPTAERITDSGIVGRRDGTEWKT